MIPPLRSFDDVHGKERGQKKTDDLRAMTALGPRTLELLNEPGMRFSTMWHFDMCRLRRAYAASFLA